MFTGIIEDLGTVAAIKRSPAGAVLTIRTAMPVARITLGESIAINGACMTVTGKGRGAFAMDISAESLRRTTLGELNPGDRVNLERCLTLGKLIGGHLVSGHVDGVGTAVSATPENASTRWNFRVPASLSRFIAVKGSVAVDGVSLTVNEVRGDTFGVNIIPHTAAVTGFGTLKPNDPVNIEIDTLARYVARLAETA